MKVLLIGYYGGINYGDEALVEVISQKLREIYSSLKLKILTLNPTYTKNIHQLEGVFYNGIGIVRSFSLFKTLLNEIKTSNVVIIGGGGILHDMKHRLSMAFYLFPLILAKIMGRSIAFLAVGIDPPIYSSLNKTLLRLVCNCVDYISVRDETSRDYLKNRH